MIETRNNQTNRSTEFGIESNVQALGAVEAAGPKPQPTFRPRRIINSQFKVQVESLFSRRTLNTGDLTHLTTGTGAILNGGAGDIFIGDVPATTQPEFDLIPIEGALFYAYGNLYFGNGDSFIQIATTEGMTTLNPATRV